VRLIRLSMMIYLLNRVFQMFQLFQTFQSLVIARQQAFLSAVPMVPIVHGFSG
jgi:hypothetical protein